MGEDADDLEGGAVDTERDECGAEGGTNVVD